MYWDTKVYHGYMDVLMESVKKSICVNVCRYMCGLVGEKVQTGVEVV